MNRLNSSTNYDPPAFGNFYKTLKSKLNNKIAPVTSVETNEPLVAITFDDGPHPLYTTRLMKIFQRFRALGTFFMVGKSALQYKSIVHEVANAGHEIGNHTMDHISMLSVGRRERWRQVQLCKKALFPYGQRYIRPPYGEQNGWSNLDAVLQGYESIGWNLDVEDWWNEDFTSMAAALRHKIGNGSILLFHDQIFDNGHPKHKTVGEIASLKREVMVQLVELVLEEFSTKYQFVTISELLKHGRVQRQEFV